MKKRVFVLVMLLTLAFSMTANAMENRAMAVVPTLTFAANKAECKVRILANNEDDTITAVIQLWENGRCLDTWDVEGTGIVSFKETVDATEGNTYKLTVDAVIDGKKQSTAYIEETYD